MSAKNTTKAKTALIFCPIPWTDHVVQAKVIERAMRRLGYQTRYALDGGGRTHSYQKLMNGRGLAQDAKVALANAWLDPFRLRSHRYRGPVPDAVGRETHWSAHASVGTAVREELDSAMAAPEHQAEIAHTNADFWHVKDQLDAIMDRVRPSVCILFNGRFHDAATCVDVCTERGIPYLSYERAWFGSGIQILNGHDCVSVSGFQTALYGTQSQAPSEANLAKTRTFIDGRLKGQALGEWRQYGQKMSSGAAAPAAVDAREDMAVIVPSSRSEFLGHPEYALEYPSSIELMQAFVDRIRDRVSHIVLRSHPAWARPVGGYATSKSLGAFQEFCRRNGIEFIPPQSDVSTYDLMARAKLGIFNGSSSVCEATELGLPVVNLGVNRFAAGNFFAALASADDIASFDLDAYLAGYDHEMAVTNMQDMIARYLENTIFFTGTMTTHSLLRPPHPTEVDLRAFQAKFDL